MAELDSEELIFILSYYSTLHHSSNDDLDWAFSLGSNDLGLMAQGIASGNQL